MVVSTESQEKTSATVSQQAPFKGKYHTWELFGFRLKFRRGRRRHLSESGRG